MRNRATRCAVLAGFVLLVTGGQVLAAASHGDSACLAAAPKPQAEALRLDAGIAAEASGRAPRTPSACLAFVADQTNSTAVLTRCLRLASARPALVPASFSKPAGEARGGTQVRLRGGCREATARRALN